MPVVTVEEALTGTDITINDNGRAAAAASKPVVLSTEDLAAVNAITTAVTALNAYLDGLEGYTDGIETLIGTTNTGVGAPGDSAWASGSGSVVALLKAIAGQAISTAASSVKIDQTTPGTTNAVQLLASTANVGKFSLAQDEYETVAASQTAQVLGATGGSGDYIAGILVIPATTSPGNVLLLDNATSITVFAGGASSVSNLVPFFIPLGIRSVSGAWKITTGSNVSCIGVGDFT